MLSTTGMFHLEQAVFVDSVARGIVCWVSGGRSTVVGSSAIQALGLSCYHHLVLLCFRCVIQK